MTGLIIKGIGIIFLMVTFSEIRINPSWAIFHNITPTGVIATFGWVALAWHMSRQEKIRGFMSVPAGIALVYLLAKSFFLAIDGFTILWLLVLVVVVGVGNFISGIKTAYGLGQGAIKTSEKIGGKLTGKGGHDDHGDHHDDHGKDHAKDKSHGDSHKKDHAHDNHHGHSGNGLPDATNLVWGSIVGFIVGTLFFAGPVIWSFDAVLHTAGTPLAIFLTLLAGWDGYKLWQGNGHHHEGHGHGHGHDEGGKGHHAQAYLSGLKGFNVKEVWIAAGISIAMAVTLALAIPKTENDPRLSAACLGSFKDISISESELLQQASEAINIAKQKGMAGKGKALVDAAISSDPFVSCLELACKEADNHELCMAEQRSLASQAWWAKFWSGLKDLFFGFTVEQMLAMIGLAFALAFLPLPPKFLRWLNRKTGKKNVEWILVGFQVGVSYLAILAIRGLQYSGFDAFDPAVSFMTSIGVIAASIGAVFVAVRLQKPGEHHEPPNHH